MITGLILGAWAVPASATPGDLDPTFGAEGIALASAPGTYSGARAVAVDSQGGIVVAGFAHINDSIEQGLMVARFRSDGSLDQGFADHGVVLSDQPGLFEEANAVAMAPDGKIVVAGRSGDDVLVARLRSDGSLDETFAGGVVLVDLGGEEVGFGLAIGPEGSVTVVGRALIPDGSSCCLIDALVLRLDPEGALDRTFGGGDGITTFDLVPGVASGGSDRLEAVVLSGGTIVATGTTGGDIATVRLRADGRMDPTFGRGGLVTTDMNGWPDEGAGLVVLPGGRILVAGTACREPGASDEDCDVALVRYRLNGSPDRSFGRGGRVTADLGAAFGEKAVGLVRLADGRIVVAAQTTADGGPDLAVARFSASGSRDRTFGRAGGAGGGVVTTDVAGATDEAGGITLQRDGRIVVAGTAGLGSGGFSSVAVRYQV